MKTPSLLMVNKLYIDKNNRENDELWHIPDRGSVALLVVVVVTQYHLITLKTKKCTTIS